MKIKSKILPSIETLLLWILGILTLLAAIKTLFISMDIDEGYAVAQSYRLIHKDQLIKNMWEPHQFSAYFSAILIYFFIHITGSTTGVVLFLRMAGTLIHFLLGLFLVGTFQKELSKKGQAILFLLHINFLAKWLQLPEFELMSYWFLLIGLLCMWHYFMNRKKKIYLVLLGICMLLQVANYPTMLLLYPIYMFGIVKIQRQSLSEVVISTLAALLPGLGFLGYLFSYMNLETFRTCLGYILTDPSHTTVKLTEKLLLYGKSLGTDILLLGGSFGICFLMAFLTKKGKEDRLPTAFLFTMILLEAIHIAGCLFFDQNQFFLQQRYLFFFLFCLACCKKRTDASKEKQLLFYFGVLPAFSATILAALLSNMTLSVSYSKLFLCVPISLLYLCMDHKEASKKAPLVLIPYLFTVCGLLVCKLLLIRVTGCLPVTINARLDPIEKGPASGILVTSDLARTMNENYNLLTEYVNEEDKLFYFGCENLVYLYTEAEICTASVQGTSVFNQSFIDYFSLYPEKQPTVIAVDKTFDQVEAYRYSPWNYIVMDWIETQSYKQKIENDYMILYLGVGSAEDSIR